MDEIPVYHETNWRASVPWDIGLDISGPHLSKCAWFLVYSRPFFAWVLQGLFLPAPPLIEASPWKP